MAQQAKVTAFDSANCAEYSYASLPTPSSIRILKLHPEFLLGPDKIQRRVCTLEIHELSNVPPYTALSYTWDGPVDNVTSLEYHRMRKNWFICQDGVYYSLLIGLSLVRALRHLTAIQGPGAVDALWIDAICINQSDDGEKGAQVSLMGQIYSQCKETIVWLGAPDDYSCDIAAFASLHETVLMGVQNHVLSDLGGDTNKLGGHWAVGHFYKRLKLEDNRSQLDWKGYLTFYEECRWFTRAWVYQEIAFAPKVSYRCGNRSLEFTHLAALANFLTNSGLASALFVDLRSRDKAKISVLPGLPARAMQHLRQNTEDIGTKAWHKAFAKLNDLRVEEVPLQFFLYCIDHMRRANSTNPRDRIYATLGFIEKSLLPGQKMTIKPDYGLSVAQVYTQAALHILRSSSNLVLLSEVEDVALRKVPSLPSWVPDFSVGTRSLVRGKTCDPYNATKVKDKGQLSAEQLCIDGHTLRLQGVCLGDVSACAKSHWKITTDDPKDSDEPMERGFLKEIQAWFDVLNSMDRKPMEQEYKKTTMLEVLWRTLTMDNDLELTLKPQNKLSNQIFHDFLVASMAEASTSFNLALHFAQGPCWPTLTEVALFKHLSSKTRSAVQRGTHVEGELSAGILAPLTASASSIANNYLRLHDTFAAGMADRKICAIGGALLGHAPLSSEEGDVVWLIDGGRVPYVLRPTQEAGAYTLVGDCYVHGVMKGEKWGSLWKKPKLTNLRLV